MIFFITLSLTVLLALLGTARLIFDGGHGCPPRSHETDRRFGPPGVTLS